MKSYTYKMKLVPANFLCIFIYIFLFVITYLLKIDFYINSKYTFIFFISLLLYFMLHELLHGIGYYLGGAKRENIKYGIALEKGLLYTLCRQEITKSNILISLQMPFTVIGVITYIIGTLISSPLLVVLSIVNIGGASMDLVMFFYILRIKNVRYSEADDCDEFVLISDEDLTKKKSLFFKITNVKNYKKEDFIFPKTKKITITKQSIIIMIVFLLLGLLCSI